MGRGGPVESEVLSIDFFGEQHNILVLRTEDQPVVLKGTEVLS